MSEGLAREGHHFPRVEGLRERDTISRTEGRDMVPNRNPVTKGYGPDPQSRNTVT